MPKSRKDSIVIFLACTFILLCGALINRFPLVYPDSGAYLYYAFNPGMPADRPVTYSLFIRLFSLGHSMWYVVIAQCLILSYLLIRCYQKFQSRSGSAVFILIAAFTAYFTGVIWYSGQLMADIFTAFVVMSLLLLLLRKFSFAETILLVVICIFSVMTHYSNFVSALLFLALLFLSIRIIKWVPDPGIALRKWFWVTIMVISPWIQMPAINYSISGEFRTTKASSIFIMGHLVENGILREYLTDNCGEKNYKLCAYVDSLPCGASYFLWNPNSPLAKTGGWEANEQEYRNIETDMLKSPKYLLRNLEEAIFYTGIQLTDNDVGGLGKNLENTTPYEAIKKYFPFEFEPYTCSLQNSNALRFNALNRRQDLVLIISALVILIFLMRSKKENQNSGLTVFAAGIGLFCICNAAVCASLANALDRLQGRISWLLVFTACLILVEQRRIWFHRLPGMNSETG